MFFLKPFIAIVAGFAVTAILTNRLIPFLRKKAGQNILEDAPESHQKKQGTPSMGGLAIASGILVAGLLTGYTDHRVFAVLITMLLYGAMGFLDDYLKVAHKQNLGLKPWQKIVIQIAIGIAAGVYMVKTNELGTSVWIPYFNTTIDFGIAYIPFITFVLVAMSNSVNLTDGLDGLAAGTTCTNFIFFTVAASIFGFTELSCLSLGMVGACLGFLLYNRNPARIFMGDTGSMALGGGLAMLAIVMHAELLLPIAGLIFVCEALSVIIQVGSFKLRGKRVFKMAPIHHHFELCGMKEHKVVIMFDFVALACCLIAYLGLPA